MLVLLFAEFADARGLRPTTSIDHFVLSQLGELVPSCHLSAGQLPAGSEFYDTNFTFCPVSAISLTPIFAPGIPTFTE